MNKNKLIIPLCCLFSNILMAQSPRLVVPVGHVEDINYVSFLSDGKTVMTTSGDGRSVVWDLSGRELEYSKGEQGASLRVSFSPDGKMMLGMNANGDTVKLTEWPGSRVLQTFTAHQSYFKAVAFSFDGSNVLTVSEDGMLRQWDLAGRLLTAIKLQEDLITSIAFAPDRKSILTCCTGKSAKQWDLSGQLLQTYTGHAAKVQEVVFSNDGKTLLASGRSTTLWDLSGRGIQAVMGHSDMPGAAAFSPDGNSVLTSGTDGAVKQWDLSGGLLKTFQGFQQGVYSEAVFSPDRKAVVFSGPDQLATLFDLSKGKSIPLKGADNEVRKAAFSPDGKWILTGGSQGARLWDLAGNPVQSFKGPAQQVNAVAFSPDGMTVAIDVLEDVEDGLSDKVPQLLDLKGKPLQAFGQGLKSFEKHRFFGINAIIFSRDGNFLLSAGGDANAKLWDVSGRLLNTFEGHTSGVQSIDFSPDGKKMATGSDDHTLKIWDIASGRELATLIALDSNDWAVTTPSGLFDASEGAKKMMYYVVDYEREKIVVDLEQLQARYWQPGLLSAVMGLSPYPVKNLGDFDNLKLFPAIEDDTRIESDQLYIKLRERNGGLGKLSLIINGRRLEDNLNPNRKKDLVIDLKPYIKSRHLRTDTLNTIELEVYESKDELKSEPYKLNYQASVNKRGEGTEAETAANDCNAPPHLYLIVVGTSLYPQGMDSLPAANEDAVEMARVLSETGKLLYDDRVHLKLLSTKAGESPSKANIAAAFEAFKTANICDVLVVFFAGHGANWGKDGDKPNFYYLTQDITFAKLNDEGIRKAYAISDQELTEWMTAIPALNQLLILDACNSGQAAVNMGGIVARDMDPDKIIAFSQMSGNTGSYVISGSSASGASFESEVFGHGLLTYSLLEGIGGTALVDVLPLLLKSYKRVGELAKSLGKEQTPIIAKPRGNASFFVGKNDGSVKIELPETKPMVIRSFLFDQKAFVDHLAVTNELNRLFRSKVIKGKQAPWFYSDVAEHPQGFSVRGTYTIDTNNKVSVRGSLTKGEKPIGEPFTVSGEPNAKVLADLIFRAVRAGIKLKG